MKSIYSCGDDGRNVQHLAVWLAIRLKEVEVMLLSSRIKLYVLSWLVVEALLFVLVVKLIGFAGAVLLGFATSFVGLSLLKRAGTSAMAKMRMAFDRRSGTRMVAIREESLTTIGGLALLMPGFLSDLVGVVLVVPVLRGTAAWLIGRSSGWNATTPHPRKQNPEIIDLDPRDWRHIDRTTPSMPRG